MKLAQQEIKATVTVNTSDLGNKKKDEEPPDKDTSARNKGQCSVNNKIKVGMLAQIQRRKTLVWSEVTGVLHEHLCRRPSRMFLIGLRSVLPQQSLATVPLVSWAQSGLEKKRCSIAMHR